MLPQSIKIQSTVSAILVKLFELVDSKAMAIFKIKQLSDSVKVDIRTFVC